MTAHVRHAKKHLQEHLADRAKDDFRANGQVQQTIHVGILRPRHNRHACVSVPLTAAVSSNFVCGASRRDAGRLQKARAVDKASVKVREPCDLSLGNAQDRVAEIPSVNHESVQLVFRAVLGVPSCSHVTARSAVVVVLANANADVGESRYIPRPRELAASLSPAGLGGCGAKLQGAPCIPETPRLNGDCTRGVHSHADLHVVGREVNAGQSTACVASSEPQGVGHGQGPGNAAISGTCGNFGITHCLQVG